MKTKGEHRGHPERNESELTEMVWQRAVINDELRGWAIDSNHYLQHWSIENE